MKLFTLIFIIIQIYSLVLTNEQGTLCQSGRAQSPIFIDLSQTIYGSYPSLMFSSGYRQSIVLEVSNKNYETIFIKPIFQSQKALLVSGGSLSGIFTFQSVHLHWPQSEHRFSKKNYTAEAHFIHKNLITNETAVFAYFFTSADSHSQEDSNEINNWNFLLQKFTTNNANITIKDGLISLMIGNKNQFVQYIGSLTTSPCTEGIHWILFSSAIGLDDTNLNRLRTNIVTTNYRDTQPLNGRIVRRSFPSTSWNT